jgi:hypothetical protein
MHKSLDMVGSNTSNKGKSRELDGRETIAAWPKIAFSLACIEQLVPALSERCVREEVIPSCIP